MLLTVHPQFRLASRGGRFVWRGTLRPTPMSAIYTVRLEYTFGLFPQVFVVDPPLRTRGDDPIPHRYGSGALCLYTPGGWSSRDYIATTIIPWTALWLYYYELWHITGEWLGGGEHPGAVEPTMETSQ